MTTSPQHGQKNILLRQLPTADYAALAPDLEWSDLEPGQCLARSLEPIEFVQFPQSGLASVTTEDDPVRVETGVIGREGFAGLSVLLGAESSPVSTFVQMPGASLRVPVPTFLDFTRRHPQSLALLLRFVQAYIIQVSSTAGANATQNVEQRLARWLLMAHDRADDDRLLLTHDFLSVMLGVRRPGVTVAVHVLEGEHAVRATRGAIQIMDRDRLKVFAGEGYGRAEAEYERLIGARCSKGSFRSNFGGRQFPDGSRPLTPRPT